MHTTSTFDSPSRACFTGNYSNSHAPPLSSTTPSHALLFLAGACFTGDTAQAIAKGVAFRFNDISTLCYNAYEALQESERAEKAAVAAAAASSGGGHYSQVVVHEYTAPKLCQMTHNYRSHEGILNLAAATITTLQSLFPNAIDRMNKDTGLFPGPLPKLLRLRDKTELGVAMGRKGTNEVRPSVC